ncbi:zf-CCHC domain-containing protein [Tanacetum coccineum]|uniref:Zf-CCHC domain-containing protein n=1 Tax=Tanacetum coccineum TaxID=301880 RepID=A0ABQ5CBG5_9ASTR
MDEETDNEPDGSMNDDSTRWGNTMIDYWRCLGIAEDVLIDVVGFVYPVDFIILDIEEDECMPVILGTPFLTTAKAEIKFYKGRMTIRADNCKVRFVRTLKHPSKIEERIKGYLDPIITTNYVNRRILEWEERIKNHQEK